jgi:hypothetical protein
MHELVDGETFCNQKITKSERNFKNENLFFKKMNSNPLDQARTILNELRLAVDKNDVKGKSLLNRAKVSL